MELTTWVAPAAAVLAAGVLNHVGAGHLGHRHPADTREREPRQARHQSRSCFGLRQPGYIWV